MVSQIWNFLSGTPDFWTKKVNFDLQNSMEVIFLAKCIPPPPKFWNLAAKGKKRVCVCVFFFFFFGSLFSVRKLKTGYWTETNRKEKDVVEILVVFAIITSTTTGTSTSTSTSTTSSTTTTTKLLLLLLDYYYEATTILHYEVLLLLLY